MAAIIKAFIKPDCKRPRATIRGPQHKMSRTPTWVSWHAMWDRCTRPSHPKYQNYGGRGISVCDRWKSFAAFFEDMGFRLAGTTIDRHPNKDGNYQPDNCRWAKIKDQNRNKRNTRMVTLPLATVAEIAGLRLARVKARLRKGWDIERALTTPADLRFSNRKKETET